MPPSARTASSGSTPPVIYRPHDGLPRATALGGGDYRHGRGRWRRSTPPSRTPRSPASPPTSRPARPPPSGSSTPISSPWSHAAPFVVAGRDLWLSPGLYRWARSCFTVASCCAPELVLPTLTAARVLQGLGAAGIMSVNTALIRVHLPVASARPRRRVQRARRRRQHRDRSDASRPASSRVASWPMLFAINVPVGLIAALALAVQALPDTPPRATGSTGRVPR